jgi:hypothetical protein
MISTEPMPRFAQTAASSAWSGRACPVSRSSDTRSGASRDLSQGKRVQSSGPQLLGVAGGEHAARDLHVGERRRLGVEADVKGGIGARRLAQQLQIGDDALGRGQRRHGLKIDRDLGADDIETDGGRMPRLARLRRQYIRGGQSPDAGDRWVLSPCAFEGPREVIAVVDQQFATRTGANRMRHTVPPGYSLQHIHRILA